MDDAVWKPRYERHRFLPRRVMNEQRILRYLRDNTSLTVFDVRNFKTAFDLHVADETLQNALERLRRRGSIRRVWNRGQMRYSLTERLRLAPLRPVEDKVDLALRGIPLTPVEIEAMERRLNCRPNNSEIREILLQSYWQSSHSRKQNRKIERRYRIHLLKMIQMRPGKSLLGMEASHYVEQVCNTVGAAEIAELWRVHFYAYPNDVCVRKNVLDFFAYSDKDSAETLLEEALSEEESPEWLRVSGERHALAAFGNDGQVDLTQAALALAAFERAWAIGTENRQSHAAEIAELAFVVGQWEKARQFAQIALTTPDPYPEDNGGDQTALHEANLIMGRLALREGDLESAGAYLLAAGDVEGSPVLCTGGPHTLLAKELLEISEREVVLRYFARCSRFWDSEFSRIPEWTRAVERGEMPNFGRDAR